MTHINQRRDTATNWASSNPVLQLGEVGWETDTRRSKLGDGTTAWNDLLYTVSTLVVTKADVGLDQVDNTSDADKPVSTAQATAINAKVIDSIADADTTHAPSRNAVFDALALKAPLASPALTGTPTAPTPAPGDNDTSIATTAFVTAALTAVPDADVQVFTADGTWTKPAGAKYVVVEMIGGGGAGGGAPATGAGQMSLGAGGGGGGYVRKKYAAGSLSATESVDVGAAGAGVLGGNGGDGQSSLFKALVAGGGKGSSSLPAGATNISGPGLGLGGTAAGGDLNVPGQDGEGARRSVIDGAVLAGWAGGGGNSVLGMGGRGNTVAGVGNAGKNYGGGGAGSLINASSAALAGGNGAPGIVIITTYFA